MKSHLAYYFMLNHALGNSSLRESPKNVLLVSMRDDVNAARDTLIRLIEQEKMAGLDVASKSVLEQLLTSDRLEILYKWHGCVTPNEVFHTIYVALAQAEDAPLLLRGASIATETPVRGTAEIVVLDGLDHLDVKFPLAPTSESLCQR